MLQGLLYLTFTTALQEQFRSKCMGCLYSAPDCIFSGPCSVAGCAISSTELLNSTTTVIELVVLREFLPTTAPCVWHCIEYFKNNIPNRCFGHASSAQICQTTAFWKAILLPAKVSRSSKEFFSVGLELQLAPISGPIESTSLSLYLSIYLSLYLSSLVAHIWSIGHL
jgi:hypothetical protein